MSDLGWQALAKAVQRRLGVRLPVTLESRLEDRASSLVVQGKARSLAHLASRVLEVDDDDEVLEELREATSVVETYFFRGTRQLERLTELLRDLRGELPATLRMLSAGCATGEEAYTLAGLASAALPATRIEVVGIDMNRKALEHARAGEYGPRSVRNEAARSLPLEHVGGRWKVRLEIRRKVTFVQGNLVADELSTKLPGTFDVIALRNVLLYAAPRDAERVVARLLQLASPRAIFLAGAVEETVVKALLPGFEVRGYGVWARGLRSLEVPVPVPSPARKVVRVSSPRGPVAAHRAAPPPPRAAPLVVQPAKGSLAIAQSAADRGDWPAATKAAREAVQEAPDAPAPRWLSGVVELGRGDALAAERHFEAALFLQRDFLPALLGLAQLLEQAGRGEASRARYQQVLSAARALPPRAQVLALDLSASAVVRIAQAALEGNVGHG